MEFNDRSLVITDLETTGLDPIIHEVIDIGAVRVDQESLEIEATFTCKIQPVYIELAHPKALEVNGYTPEAWKNAVRHDDAWQSFFSFGRQGVFSSWSVSFDWGFVDPAIRFYHPEQRFGPFDRHLIDLPSVAWGIVGPVAKVGKDAVAEVLGLEPEPLPHDGLAGALHALTILRRLRRLVRNNYAQAA